MHDEDPKTQYRCPGQDYPISRAVHLARLAGFYPGCRMCVHWDDRDGLSRRAARRVEETRERAGKEEASLFFDDGAAGAYLNDIGPPQSLRMAAALGLVLREAREPNELEPPVVIVAGDGRPIVPELVAAVAEGLRWSGYHVVDIGSASGGCTAFAVGHFEADGGVLVGNPGRKPQTVGLKFWGARGVPLSTGQGRPSLDDVRRVYEDLPGRPCRKYGSLRRLQVEDDYLATLSDHYHALRPLRILLDCGCGPLREYLERLTEPLACEIIRYRADGNGRSSKKSKGAQGWLAAERSDAPDAKHWGIAALCPSHPSMLEQAVVECGAHLGVSIEGNGETCAVYDERGRAVESERLTELVGRHLSAQIDGDTDGRLRYSDGGVPRADALRTVTLLLEILSQSDRPLSGVLDELGAKG